MAQPGVFLASIAALLMFTGTAGALERSGRTTIDIDGRVITEQFTAHYDPATGVLVRKGTLILSNGRRGTYRLMGTCGGRPLTCTFTGTGTGPFGQPWRGSGTLSRRGERVMIKATLKGPRGRTIRINRETSGDSFADLGL
ncbi:hypothetical protein OSH11_16930 [Kaistia dalseonensis]|uniref:Uncharacterized protein n=1 Tax=Kaistia dalseonensis TaxID=410840 RepID=A0ABU0H9L7_9HYPH|nr:hypothetical protein [Kaistia dalseonensis]MCX5496393.1 hypothetical protein [Kaistia dalseonensis]MDQ0439014.1 hypothetical protein [Kaistia dalseonensis]